jgi:hypothetical protein
MPDLSAGVCCLGKYPADWWVGTDRHSERKQAIALCQACPVLQACRTWALAMPVADADTTIYGGMTGHQRTQEQARRRRLAEVPAGGARRNASKLTCDAGHKLAGRNLVLVRDPRDGRTYRACRACRNVAKRAYEARRRMLDREGVNAAKRARYAAQKLAA